MRALLLAAALLVLPALPAAACRCTEPSAEAAFARADVVALVRIEAMGEPGTDGAARGHATVLRAFKGSPPPLLRLVTGEDCAFPLQVGETWLLYLAGGPEEWGTYRCRGNLPLAEAAPRIAALEARRR